MNNPKFSIVMPTYNCVTKIPNAINSILKQTYPDWELIIVDDGSSDQTRQFIKKFQDPRIKYFYQEHAGIVPARNHGISVANGEWIVTQDADDLSLPDRLEKVLPYLAKGDVIVTGLYLNMWDDQYQCMMREYHKPGDIKKILKAQTLAGIAIFKKSVWEQKPFRLATMYAFDWMMHLDWILSGFKYVLVDMGLYEYIRYSASASQVYEQSGKRAQSIENIKKIVKKEYGQKVGSGVLR